MTEFGCLRRSRCEHQISTTHIMGIIMQSWSWGTFYAYEKGEMNPPEPITKCLRHPYQHPSWKNERPQHTWNSTRTMQGEMVATAPRGFRRRASLFQPILNDNQVFGMTRRTVPSWVHTITQRPQPPPMTYCSVKKIRSHNANQIKNLGRWHLSSVTMQKSAIQSQETMIYHLRISRAPTARKWDTMWGNTRHQQLTLVWGHNQYR